MTNFVIRRLVCVSEGNICKGSMSCFINIYDCVNKKMVKVFCQIWTQRQIIYEKNDFVLQKQCMTLHYISQYHNPTYLQDTHTILPVACLIWGAYVFPKPRAAHPLEAPVKPPRPPPRLPTATLKAPKNFNWTPFEAPKNVQLYPLGPDISNSTPCLDLRLPKTSNCTPLRPPLEAPKKLQLHPLN